MSSAGSISAMVTSLKNNKRDRKSALKRLKESSTRYSVSEKLHFEKKASPLQLKKIREHIQRRNKKIFIQKIVAVGILSLLLIYVIGFAKI
ncbi:MAG: hypothetical protein MK076_01540 [Flavobacteriales bacterium]|nr:hypothetical protein [Flavobacteriales bacterium]